MKAIVKVNDSALTEAAGIEALCRKWLEYLDASPATSKSYRTGIHAYITFLGIKGIRRPTRDDIIAFKAELEKEKAAATIRLYLQAVKHFHDFLAVNGLYEDIYRGIRAPKMVAGHKRDALTPQQVKEVLSGIGGDTLAAARDRALLAMMVGCGLRCCELQKATVEDITDKGGRRVLWVQGKGHQSKDTYIPIPAAVLNILDDYLAISGKRSGCLFFSISNNKAGSPLTVRSISRIVKGHLRAAGIDSDRITAHSLRHTAATAAIDSGVAIHKVKAYLRHSNINTTMIYIHEREQEKNPCAAALDDLFC